MAKVRCRNICYTKFALIDDSFDDESWIAQAESWMKLWQPFAKYHIFQLECCPTTSRLHFQGYVQLNKQEYMSKIRNISPGTHIEVQSSPLNEQASRYCEKPDTYIAGPWSEGTMKKGANSNFPPLVTKGNSNGNQVYTEAFEAPTVTEGMNILRQKRPRDMAIHGQAIERNLKRAKVERFVPKYSLADFTHPPLDFAKPTLVWGNSGLGKTQFVLSHFKTPLLVSHIDKLRDFNPLEHDAIVFDDMSFEHTPPTAVIHLLDLDCERDIHVRYGVATIPPNTIKVFTHNCFNPFYKLDIPTEQQVAIERRLTRVNITVQCFQ